MLSKIPIISTNVGGTKEFLNKKNSNIVKPYSPENIKELLKDYLKIAFNGLKSQICIKIHLSKA